MSIDNQALSNLFAPRTVALVGASARPGALGETVMRNLLRGEFAGTILPVNPKHRSVFGVWCHRSVADLPVTPDLAVLCTPPPTLPGLVEELAGRGTRMMVVMTADPHGRPGRAPTPLKTALLETARRTGVRLLGPGSTGLQVTRIGLNASWITAQALPGRLALVSQSAAMTAGVVAWATSKGVGFSHIVSAGDAADVNSAEILDHLGTDGRSRAVLLLLKEVSDSRRFLSAARDIARVKPVVVLVVGRDDGPDVTIFPNGEAVVGVSQDAVYDAAIRRAGMLRVRDTDELFAAVETLSIARRPVGDRLALVGNGSGPGDVAAAVIAEGGGRVAALSQDTCQALAALTGMPQDTTGVVDLGRGADSARFREAVTLVQRDQGSDAVLALHVPTASAPTAACATALAGVGGNLLACFLGADEGEASRRPLSAAGVPIFSTPERAARAFLHLVHYRRNQEMLVQIPASVAACAAGERQAARRIVDMALDGGRGWLDEEETFLILATYGVPVLPLRVAASPDEAVEAARRLGPPVTLRQSMRGHLRHYPRDDVIADLTSLEGVAAAAQRVLAAAPELDFDGRPPRLVVQQAPRWSDAVPLAAGIGRHPAFGLVIHVRGAKGANVAALPPLNSVLADELLERAGLAASLGPSPASRGIDLAALRTALVRLSELAVDLPEIQALTLDPLVSAPAGVMALDARLVVVRPEPDATHLAIRPYPRELEEEVRLADGRTVFLRPIRPENEPAYREMLTRLAPKDLYLRFCQTFGGDVAAMPVVPLVHIDYDRQMTLVALLDGAIVGTVELTMLPVGDEAEYSVLVRSDMKGQGLGRLLMERIIARARVLGVGTVVGLILKENAGMLALARKLGFRQAGGDDEDDMVKMALPLR